MTELIIEPGRAGNKSGVSHLALASLDAITRGHGPEGASFRNADELDTPRLHANEPVYDQWHHGHIHLPPRGSAATA
jgi:hypothetical protein